MQFVFNDMILAESEVIQMKAGTMVVMPSSLALDEDMASQYGVTLEDKEDAEIAVGEFPRYLIVCAGQSLKRESYPGWNSEYDGGFYDFTLPNLVNKFVVGFDPDGEPIKGTGCIYHIDVPEIEAPMPRDVRQMPDGD